MYLLLAYGVEVHVLRLCWSLRPDACRLCLQLGNVFERLCLSNDLLRQTHSPPDRARPQARARLEA